MFRNKDRPTPAVPSTSSGSSSAMRAMQSQFQTKDPLPSPSAEQKKSPQPELPGTVQQQQPPTRSPPPPSAMIEPTSSSSKYQQQQPIGGDSDAFSSEPSSPDAFSGAMVRGGAGALAAGIGATGRLVSDSSIEEINAGNDNAKESDRQLGGMNNSEFHVSDDSVNHAGPKNRAAPQIVTLSHEEAAKRNRQLVAAGAEEMFTRIVKAAREEDPFSTINDPPGSGVMSLAVAKIPRDSCKEAAGYLTQVGVGDLDVGFSLFALVLEIFRDFFQLMALMFAFMFVVPVNINLAFGTFAFIINLDFNMILPAFGLDIGTIGFDPKWIFVGMWWGMFIISVICMIYLRYIVYKVTPKPRREFIMCKTWAMMDASIVTKVKICTFLLTSLYLPVSQRGLEIVTCSYRYFNIFGECASFLEMVSAVVALILITVILPVVLYRLIANNIPKRREFDDSGLPLEVYTAEMYQKALAATSRKNPLASLFNPYRRKMAFFKVVIMGLKFYMVLVSVCLSSNNLITGHNFEVTPAASSSSSSSSSSGAGLSSSGGAGGIASSMFAASPSSFSSSNASATVASSSSGFTTAVPPTAPPTPVPSIIPETENNLFNHIRPGAMIFGLLGYAILCAVHKPFLATLANVFDVILRLVGLVAIAMAWLIMFGVEPSIVEWVLIGVMGVAIVMSVIFIVISCDCVQQKIRVSRASIDLAESPQDENATLWYTPKHIDWVKERKVRVWMKFWDDFLGFYPGFTPPLEVCDGQDGRRESVDSVTSKPKVKYPLSFDYVDTDETTAYLLDFKGSVAERHHENREIVADVGRDIYFEGLKHLTDYDAKCITFATRMLHGRDCFFSRGTGDANSGSFGCLYLMPFPFEGFFISDGSNIETKLGPADLKSLIADNCNPEVRRRRRMREQLRGLAILAKEFGRETNFFFQEQRQVKISAGGGQQGGARSVSVLCTFTVGKLVVTQDYETPVFEKLANGSKMEITPGFTVTLEYSGGTYTEHGGGKCGPRTLNMQELGITPDFQDTPKLQHLWESNSEALAHGHQYVLARKDSYRTYFMREFLTKQKTLSYAFFAEIYDDENISETHAARHLRDYEKNGKIRSIGQSGADKHDFFKMAQLRLKYYDCCRPVALWTLFWQDLFTENLEMDIIADNEDAKNLLNPFLPDSISWNICSRTVCNDELKKAGLQTESGGGFISSGVIDKLYSALQKASRLEQDEQDNQRQGDTTTAGSPTTSSAVREGVASAANNVASMMMDKVNMKQVSHQRYFEVAAFPLYESCLVPLYRESANDPGLSWIKEMAAGAEQDFYDSNVSQHVAPSEMHTVDHGGDHNGGRGSSSTDTPGGPPRTAAQEMDSW